MGQFSVVQTRAAGVNVLIIPVSEFGHKSQRDQHIIRDEIQNRAQLAGLSGIVALVWDGGQGAMTFMAPEPLHDFLRSIDLKWVVDNINNTVQWPD